MSSSSSVFDYKILVTTGAYDAAQLAVVPGTAVPTGYESGGSTKTDPPPDDLVTSEANLVVGNTYTAVLFSVPVELVYQTDTAWGLMLSDGTATTTVAPITANGGFFFTFTPKSATSVGSATWLLRVDMTNRADSGRSVIVKRFHSRTDIGGFAMEIVVMLCVVFVLAAITVTIIISVFTVRHIHSRGGGGDKK